MTILRSLAFNAAFLAWTVLLVLAGLFALAVPRVATRWIGIAWAKGSLFLLRVLFGARFEFRGDRARLDGPCLVASKHQSTFDTMVYYILAPDPVYVMKIELMRVPIFGWMGRKQRMIPVDRKGGGAALKRLLRGARDSIAAGRQIVIFMQGTRTPPGATTAEQPYLPGVAALYQALALPVIPVALNTGVVWGRRSFFKRPGTMVVELLPDIPAGLARPEFMRRLAAAIEPATARLEEEAGFGAKSRAESAG